MNDVARASENRAVKTALQAFYCPEPIREARQRQDEILIDRFRGGSYKIADIGCGTGYHGSIFAPSCSLYHGFEIAPEIAEIAREQWRQQRLDQARVFLGDVTEMDIAEELYDLAFCLYFTPGNFRDISADLSFYSDAYLDQNPKFMQMVAKFYRALVEGGRMLLTIYKDVPAAEAAQIDFYEHNDQQVITPRGSRFVATAERFWSVRWTRASMLSNLRGCRIGEGAVDFHDLNEIAWLVEIRK